MIVRLLAPLILLSPLWAGGCGSHTSKGSGSIVLRGTVAVAGEPIGRGAINFRSTQDGKGVSIGPGGSAEIKNGAYVVNGIEPGKYLVAITTTVENFEQPRQVCEVAEGSSTTFDFDLPKKKGR